MSGVPVVCDSCSWRGSANDVIAGDAKGLTLIGNRYLCPQCGRWARIVDGTYDVSGSAFTMTAGSDQSWREFVEIMSGERWTRDRAERVHRALASPGHGGKPDHVVEQVKRQDRELGEWLKKMSREPAVIGGVIAAVGTIVAALIATYGASDQPPTKIEITQIVEREIPPAGPSPTTGPGRHP